MIISLKNSIADGALHIVSRLQQAGFRAFWVGGAVRDALLGHVPQDIDIATSARPEQIKELFDKTCNVGESFGIVVVIHDSRNYEVATFREERGYADGRHPDELAYTDAPEIDSRRRDFTVNAMYYDPVSGELLDFHDGRGDLRRGLIRTVGRAEGRFSEDYLRMLRAVRFSNKLNFDLDPDTRDAIRALAGKVVNLSAERLREELTAMLTGPAPAESVEQLLELGLLRHILPETAAMDGVQQPEQYHPEGDVFVHTMLMLRHMRNPSPLLAWSILLHDVGKPATLTHDDQGIPHFYGHEEAGADIADTILQRLKFSNHDRETIVHAVRNHMRFAHVDKMRPASRRRLMAEPAFPMELELHRIDCVSSNKLMGNYVLLLDLIPEFEHQLSLPPPLISGGDLIRLGATPGPRLGAALKHVRELQLDNAISTPEEALHAASTIIELNLQQKDLSTL